MARYTNSMKRTTNEFVSELLSTRGDKQATYHTIPSMGIIKESDYDSLSIKYHTWKQGDKLYKLADTYYGDSSLWWLIGWFNKKPTDNLFNLGDTVEIPLPVQNALSIYKRITNLNI